MKKILSVLIILFVFPTYCLSEPSIPIKNQVVLDKGSDYLPYKKIWKPSVDDTQKALTAIYNFLKSPEKEAIWRSGNYEFSEREIKNIYDNISKYNVQFVGIISKGKKRIYCNFFPNEIDDYWKKDLVFVFDGGFWFWQIEYDLETGKCLNFQSNGYA